MWKRIIFKKDKEIVLNILVKTDKDFKNYSHLHFLYFIRNKVFNQYLSNFNKSFQFWYNKCRNSLYNRWIIILYSKNKNFLLELSNVVCFIQDIQTEKNYLDIDNCIFTAKSDFYSHNEYIIISEIELVDEAFMVLFSFLVSNIFCAIYNKFYEFYKKVKIELKKNNPIIEKFVVITKNDNEIFKEIVDKESVIYDNILGYFNNLYGDTNITPFYNEYNYILSEIQKISNLGKIESFYEEIYEENKNIEDFKWYNEYSTMYFVMFDQIINDNSKFK